MMALIYKIRITEGEIAFAHGMTKTIEEAYFPLYGLFINKESCFVLGKEAAKQRYKQALELAGGVDVDVDPLTLVEFAEDLKETTRMTKILRRKLFKG
jgi:hypothetical protein